VWAQAIERNLPPASQAEAPIVLAPNVVPGNQDDHTLVPAVKALVILGPGDALRTNASAGVNAARVPRLNTRAGLDALKPFLGRPLSHKLIAEIEARIAKFYRRAGYPFVSLSTPPQIIGGGVLHIRVVEFHDGSVSVSGVKGAAASHVLSRVRLKPGQTINADQLSDDLDWLNRSPFHHVEAVFSPGDSLGATNLTLQVTETKRWTIYAGYANSGSRSTDLNRLLLGGQIGDLLVRDSLLSYQFTASPDAFEGAAHPDYLSHGLRAEIPLGPRQQIETSFDYVSTQIVANPFVVRQATEEFSAGYRSSLSNAINLPGDVTAGIEAKREQHTTLFGGAEVVNGAFQVFEFYAGWSDVWSTQSGTTSINLSIYESPGGLNRHNRDQAFATFTNDRVSTANYQYATAQISHTTRLPRTWALTNTVIAQYADAALPDTEQAGIGGPDLVRGYTLDDRAFDSAIVSRNEVRAPSFALLGRRQKFQDQLAPFAFFDAGYGASRTVRKTIGAASAGLGADYALANTVSANLTAAYAFANGIETRSGEIRILTKITITF
jgi:hemolysin activation/secretion protein